MVTDNFPSKGNSLTWDVKILHWRSRIKHQVLNTHYPPRSPNNKKQAIENLPAIRYLIVDICTFKPLSSNISSRNHNVLSWPYLKHNWLPSQSHMTSRLQTASTLIVLNEIYHDDCENLLAPRSLGMWFSISSSLRFYHRSLRFHRRSLHGNLCFTFNRGSFRLEVGDGRRGFERRQAWLRCGRERGGGGEGLRERKEGNFGEREAALRVEGGAEGGSCWGCDGGGSHGRHSFRRCRRWILPTSTEGRRGFIQIPIRISLL